MEQQVSELLATNLAAVARQSTVLAERLRWPTASAHIQFEDNGQPVYCVLSNRHAFTMSEQVLSEHRAQINDERPLFLFGISLGEGLAYFLENTTVAQITVWDRDPWLVRLALSKYDFSEALTTGRVKLLLGVDLVEHLPAVMGMPRVAVPYFEKKYRHEWSLVQRGISDKRLLLCAGTLFVEDLSDVFYDAGYSIYTWDLAGLSSQELLLTAVRFKPTLAAAINYTAGLAESCAVLSCPLLCWEVDPATDRVAPVESESESAYIYTFREQNVNEFKRAGFANVEYVPLAANTKKRIPAALPDDERARYGAAVSFVGSSMAHQAEVLRAEFFRCYGQFAGGSADKLADARETLAQLLLEQRQDFSNYRLPETFAREFAPFISWMLRQGSTEDPVRWAAEISASEKRLTYLQALGEFSVHAWGDAGLRAIESHGGIYRGYAGHDIELNKIYASTGVNVDINRIYQADIVTMRVFDVLACGGFVLVEHSDALADLFATGSEIETFRTLKELRDKVSFYAQHQDKAAEIALRGLKRVQRDHTIEKRVEYMLTRMKVTAS